MFVVIFFLEISHSFNLRTLCNLAICNFIYFHFMVFIVFWQYSCISVLHIPVSGNSLYFTFSHERVH